MVYPYRAENRSRVKGFKTIQKTQLANQTGTQLGTENATGNDETTGGGYPRVPSEGTYYLFGVFDLRLCDRKMKIRTGIRITDYLLNHFVRRLQTYAYVHRKSRILIPLTDSTSRSLRCLSYSIKYCSAQAHFDLSSKAAAYSAHCESRFLLHFSF